MRYRASMSYETGQIYLLPTVVLGIVDIKTDMDYSGFHRRLLITVSTISVAYDTTLRILYSGPPSILVKGGRLYLLSVSAFPVAYAGQP